MWKTPANILPLQVWCNLILIILTWCSTAFIQVPRQFVLTHGYDEKVFLTLLKTNWFRTVIWTIRGVIVLWMIACLIK